MLRVRERPVAVVGVNISPLGLFAEELFTLPQSPVAAAGTATTGPSPSGRVRGLENHNEKPRPDGALRRELALAFIATGAPKPKGSMRHVGNGRMIDQVKGTGAWGDAVEDATKTAMAIKHVQTYGGFPAGTPIGFPLFGPLVVELVVTVPALKKPRRWPITRSSADLDKHQRNVGDALTSAGVMKDDSQIVRWEAEKTYPGQHPDALAEPGAVIRIWTIGGAA